MLKLERTLAEGEAKLIEANSALGAAEAKLRELEAGDVELQLEQGTRSVRRGNPELNG
jgi:hypothetical protein